MAYRTPYWERRRMEEEKRVSPARILAEPEKEAAKLARREAFDKWNLREKPGPATAEVFADRGPSKLTSIVHYGQKGDPVGAELTEALRAGRLGVRPRAPAGIEKTRAEAEGIRYDIESQKGLRGSIESILRTRAEEQAFGLEEARREVRLRDEAETEAVERAEAAKPLMERPPEPARPTRKLRPSIRKFLWEGEDPARGKVGLAAPLKGYLDVLGLAGRGLKDVYEYAFPRTK